MSGFVIVLFIGLGVGAFFYNKLYRSSGGNNKTSLIAAAIFGLLAGLVAWTILSFIPS